MAHAIMAHDLTGYCGVWQSGGAVFGNRESHVTITSSHLSGNTAYVVSECTKEGDALIVRCVHGVCDHGTCCDCVLWCVAEWRGCVWIRKEPCHHHIEPSEWKLCMGGQSAASLTSSSFDTIFVTDRRGGLRILASGCLPCHVSAQPSWSGAQYIDFSLP